MRGNGVDVCEVKGRFALSQRLSSPPRQNRGFACDATNYQQGRHITAIRGVCRYSRASPLSISRVLREDNEQQIANFLQPAKTNRCSRSSCQTGLRHHIRVCHRLAGPGSALASATILPSGTNTIAETECSPTTLKHLFVLFLPEGVLQCVESCTAAFASVLHSLLLGVRSCNGEFVFQGKGTCATVGLGSGT